MLRGRLDPTGAQHVDGHWFGRLRLRGVSAMAHPSTRLPAQRLDSWTRLIHTVSDQVSVTVTRAPT